MSIQWGIYVMCHYGTEHAPEPEGTVIFDDYPKVGDRKILCDGKEYEVFRVYDDLRCDMKMVEKDNEEEQCEREQASS